MSIRKHSDYGSYITRLRYSTYFNDIHQNQLIANSQTNIPPIELNQNIYNSYKSTGTKINTKTINTFIVEPIDNILSEIHTVYNLDASPDIPDGFIKRIINSCPISNQKTITIFSTTPNNIGAFNNVGQFFNTYLFPCQSDSLELIWSSYNNYWSVQKYGGVFKNSNN
jgi:hypothetical protein